MILIKTTNWLVGGELIPEFKLKLNRTDQIDFKIVL